MLNRASLPWPVACLAAILCLTLRSAGPAAAQGPEPALEAAEPDDDLIEEDEPEEEPPIPEETPADDEADADNDAEDDAYDEAMDDGETVDIVEWEPNPMDDGEVWAADIVEDEADDAIPDDPELEAPDEEWIEEYVDDGDGMEDDPVEVSGGFRESGDLPTVRRVPRRAAPPAGTVDDVPYSTGGKPVRDAGAPWQAQVYYPNSAPQWADKLAKGTPLWQLQHYCGGTLIERDWVLTAAHCIDEDMVKAGYRVRLGAQDISKDDGWTYKIDRIVRHSGYGAKKLPATPNMYANDIALIHIVEDVKQPPRDPVRVRAIPLYERPLPAGAEVTGTGWGKTEAVEGHAPSAVLMKVDLRVMDTERCRQLPGYGPQKIHPNVICAAHPQRSTCQGDSGGALILTNGAPTVAGVVSWGKKRCAGDGQPGAYTRVESYGDWIRQAMLLDPTKNALP